MHDWRLIHGATGAGLEAGTGARNMAVDHALLESVQAGGRPVLRLYRWSPACLSFGRNQHVVGVYDPARLAASGVDAVRRPTGGLAVLHDRELTYCLLIPLERLGGPRETYRRINLGLVEGLRRLGVPAMLAGGGAARDPRRDTAQPCFQAPAEGEVVAGGRKLVGSAQRCEHHTLLQHGSILLDGSQQDVLGLLCAAPAQPAPAATAMSSSAGAALLAALRPAAESTTAVAVGRPRAGSAVVAAAGPEAAGSTTLRELLGTSPDATVVAVAVAEGIESVCGIRLAPEPLTHGERARADELEAHYAAPTWTWRR